MPLIDDIDSIPAIDHGKNRGTPLFRLAALQKKGDKSHMKLLSDSVLASFRTPNADLDGSERARFYSVIGKPDSANYWLNHMVGVKSGFLFTGGLPCYDLFASLYNDPRWDVLLKRVNAVRCQR